MKLFNIPGLQPIARKDERVPGASNLQAGTSSKA
jgi:hypothetical protein